MVNFDGKDFLRSVQVYGKTGLGIRVSRIVYNIPYLCESSAHRFRGFLDPKNRVHIRIDGTLHVHAKSETTISLLVGS